MNNLGIILIATRKYGIFVQPLIDSLDQHMKVPFTVYLFTDDVTKTYTSDKASILSFEIESLGFPWVTLYRYRIINDHRGVFTTTHLLYMDVDMMVVADIGEEFFVDGLLSVVHPGFQYGGWGSVNTPQSSMSYVHPDKRGFYKCGGIQGGEKSIYLFASAAIDFAITVDDNHSKNIGYSKNFGILAEWHDESHWNWFLSHTHFNITTLNSSYCYPESWKLPFDKKILALDKNHKEIRS